MKVIPFLLAVSLVALLSTCANVDVKPKNGGLFWPSSTATPRVEFEQSFSTPDELGIGRSFWQWVGDVVFGGDETHMIRPMDVVTVGLHLIYVADPGVRGIHRFDTRDQSYELIQGKLNDAFELPSPVALAANKQGDVFLTDSRLAKLLVIRNGEDFAQPVVLNTPLQQPTGLSIEPNTGDIYLIDTPQHQVLIFSANGKLKKRIGKRGIESGEFNFPTHIQISHNRLMVTDSLNFRIQLFDLEGKFLQSFGQAGQSSGYLSRPKGIAMDKTGHIYVVDGLLNNIQLFDEKGQLLMSLGEQGQLPGQFWLPTGIHINEQQKIYVADSHNRRVQVFRYIESAL